MLPRSVRQFKVIFLFDYDHNKKNILQKKSSWFFYFGAVIADKYTYHTEFPPTRITLCGAVSVLRTALTVICKNVSFFSFGSIDHIPAFHLCQVFIFDLHDIQV